MNSLEIEGLKLELIEKDNMVILKWKGKSRHMNPAMILDPYFSGILNNLINKEFIMDFSQLDTMNSSTVPPILSFIKELEEKQIKTEIKYDSSLGWQYASFVPISTITQDYKFIKVLPI